MNESLETFKTELESFGITNDSATKELARRMLNITRDTGAFLSVLVRAMAARRVLEIGTSNGYSTLWLAEATRTVGGRVTTLEVSDYKIGLATENFTRSGLKEAIVVVREDAGRYLREARSDAFDFVFLDSERAEYVGWWPDLRRVLRRGGLLVADNAISHPQEIGPFIETVSQDSSFTTSLVPVGNGEFLATRSPT